MEGHRLKIRFQPYNYQEGGHLIEKDEGGQRRRYLKGVTSGIEVDGHGERMTEECIKDFSEQAKKGDILLYADEHGIKASEDIGIMVDHEVIEKGDWVTIYRLYDQSDGVGNNTLERVDKLWKQLNGEAPYKTPRQMGFSIEGMIPESDGIIQVKFGKRIINKVLLDGVVLVPRPAYQGSVAEAIMKALGEDNIRKVKKDIQESLATRIEEDEKQKTFVEKKYILDDTFNNEIDRIMTKANCDKEAELDILFDEYKNLMVKCLIENKDRFKVEKEENKNIFLNKGLLSKSNLDILKELQDKLTTIKGDNKCQK